jgi:hypothetical protein
MNIMLVILLCSPLQEGSVREIEREFELVLPGREKLALYTLDWVPTLEEARTRAAKENRPVLFILVRNDFGNFFTGHC